jgi:nucleotide-binding universal stress UspA family protein
METLPAAPTSPGEATAVESRVPVVVGEGDSWGEALHDVAWTSGDVLVVGTSSGPFSRIFLGSHAAKIVRNSPVPVVLVPRG